MLELSPFSVLASKNASFSGFHDWFGHSVYWIVSQKLPNLIQETYVNKICAARDTKACKKIPSNLSRHRKLPWHNSKLDMKSIFRLRRWMLQPLFPSVSRPRSVTIKEICVVCVRMYVCMYLCIYVFLYVGIYVCTYVFMYICTYMYFVCIYVCMSV